MERIIFVLGYGRSGTSILINLLQHYYKVDVHGERSVHFMNNFILDTESFERYLNNSKFRVVALKPILNSHNASELLRKYEQSEVIWLYRDYKDVVYSARKKFGDRVALEMKNYITKGEGDGWIARFMPEIETQMIRELNYTEYSLNDWMALVWWSVNNVVRSQDIYKEEKVMLVSYYELTNKSNCTMRKVVEHLSLKNKGLHKYLKSGRIGKGSEISLNRDIEEMCKQLMSFLNKVKY